MTIKRLITTAAVLAATLASVSLAVSNANAATVKPACSDSYVVASTPLVENGNSSWNYGYLQLWYDGCTGDNWGRLVSLVGSGNAEVSVYNTNRAGTDHCASVTIVTSGSIYSPNYNAGTQAEIYVGSALYSATVNQSGANFSDDYPGIVCQP